MEVTCEDKGLRDHKVSAFKCLKRYMKIKDSEHLTERNDKLLAKEWNKKRSIYRYASPVSSLLHPTAMVWTWTLKFTSWTINCSMQQCWKSDLMVGVWGMGEELHEWIASFFSQEWVSYCGSGPLFSLLLAAAYPSAFFQRCISCEAAQSPCQAWLLDLSSPVFRTMRQNNSLFFISFFRGCLYILMYSVIETENGVTHTAEYQNQLLIQRVT